MSSVNNPLMIVTAIVCLTLSGVASASNASVPTPSGKIGWLRVPDDLLSGKGIDQPFDLGPVEHVGAVVPDTIKHVFSGQLRAGVMQGGADAIHFPSFPDDEFFCLLVGSLTLTADEDRREQTFYAGDCAFVPKGWAGVWRQHPGVYREFAAVPPSYSFSTPIESNPAVKGARAFPIEVPEQAGSRRLHTGALIIEVENSSADKSRSVTAEHDTIIRIVKGNLTLQAADQSEIFKPGDIVILPKGLKVAMLMSAGYRAQIVRTP